MFAAVDLDQLAQARPSCPRLVDLRRSLPARRPQAGVGHQPADCLLGEANAVTLPQLLAGQRRPEIGIAVTDDRQRQSSQVLIQPPITGTPTFARSQSGGARLAVTIHQTLDLTHGHAQSFGRASGLESHVHHGLDYLQTVEFSHVQCHQCTWIHGRLRGPARNRQAYRGQNTTFLFGSATTLLLGFYIQSGDNLAYVK
ncbi:hypothetical protein WM28_31090 [Burkholderia ubonensis]|nr:hypothetical protein WJ80_25615 [Burkholderia ubonensis]KWO59118.1 hypothetical protein WM28_31090 [Burkholderia ubonensis]